MITEREELPFEDAIENLLQVCRLTINQRSVDYAILDYERGWRLPPGAPEEYESGFGFSAHTFVAEQMIAVEEKLRQAYRITENGKKGLQFLYGPADDREVTDIEVKVLFG